MTAISSNSNSILMTVDGEAVEDLDAGKIKTTRTESGAKPAPGKDHIAGVEERLLVNLRYDVLFTVTFL